MLLSSKMIMKEFSLFFNNWVQTPNLASFSLSEE